jgi:hypothetical protein
MDGIIEHTPPGFSTHAIRTARRACCSGLKVFNPNVEMTKAALSGGKLLASRSSSMNSIPR